jgi:hypothetical protein
LYHRVRAVATMTDEGHAAEFRTHARPSAGRTEPALASSRCLFLCSCLCFSCFVLLMLSVLVCCCCCFFPARSMRGVFVLSLGVVVPGNQGGPKQDEQTSRRQAAGELRGVEEQAEVVRTMAPSGQGRGEPEESSAS